MPSPFHNPAAFAPFYDLSATICGQAQSGTFKACVFEEGLADPLSEASTGTEVKHVLIVIPKTGPGGWNNPQPPVRGDKVTMTEWAGVPGEHSFAVESVEGDGFAGEWHLKAREVAA